MRRSLLIAFLSSAFFFLLDFLPAYHIQERHFLDLAFRIRGAEAPHPDIVVIEIDDKSLQAVGAWPWPRRVHAAVLKTVSRQKPRAVFYDMVFPEVSGEEDDRAFAEEMARAGNVILPFYFAAPDAKAYSAANAVFPIPRFLNAARAVGYVNASPDRDGHMREIRLAVRDSARVFVHAGLAIASVHLGEQARVTTSEPFGIARVQLGERRPSPESILINFPGPYENFNRVPVTALLAESDAPARDMLLKSLAGKVVLIGLTAPGTGMDHKPTAFAALYPGVGVQASLVHTLLTGKIIHRPARWLHWILLFGFALCIVRASAGTRLLQSVLTVAGASAAAFIAAQLAFKFFSLWIPVLSFLACGLALFARAKAAEFIHVRFERELMARELALARSIQKSFLAETFPDIPGLSLAAASFPARDVGGDLYDVLPLAHGKWGLCVGDVSGKGVPAALFMAKTVSELRREAHDDPVRVVSRLNDKIANDGASGLFFTLLYLVVDPKSRKFWFASGGHEPLMVFRAKTKAVEFLKTKQGMPLGVMADGVFDKVEEKAEPGDVLLLVSDGVKEAMDAKRQIFGFDRLQASLAQCAAQAPGAILESVLADIRSFVRSAAQHDDLTLLCAKFE